MMGPNNLFRVGSPGRGQQQRGVALVMVMIALVMAGVLAITFMGRQNSNARIAQNVSDHAAARQIAESGLTTAIQYVRVNSDWREQQVSGIWLADQAYGDGVFRIMFEDPDGDLSNDAGDTVTITALGIVGGVTHQVSAEVTAGDSSIHVLMVVPDADSLSYQDEQRQALLEGWGLVVTPFSASASAASYAAQVASHDVAYVTEDATESDVSAKLTGLAIGVVCEQRDLADELGLASSSTGYAGTTIDITSNDHYITSPFPETALTISDSAYSLNIYNGSLPGAAVNPAERPSTSQAVLVTLDAGQSLVGGGAAGGRCVMLPWGGSGFDIDGLNTSGQTLLRRAILWASGGQIGDAYGIAAMGSIDIDSDVLVDSYHSSSGSYGGSNVGDEAVLATDSTDSGDITIAGTVNGDAFGGYGGDPNDVISINGGTLTGSTASMATPMAIETETPEFTETVTGLDGSMTYGTPGGPEETYCWDEIKLSGKKVLTIDGPVRARVEGDVDIAGQASIDITSTGSLTLYLEGGLKVAGLGNSGGDPRKLKIFMQGSNTAKITGNGVLYAAVIGEQATLDMAGNGEIYGLFLGKEATLEENAQFHQDMSIQGIGLSETTTSSQGNAQPRIVWVEAE